MFESFRSFLSYHLLPTEVKKAVGDNTNFLSTVMSSSASGGATTRLGTSELLRAYSNMPWLRAIVNKVGKSVSTTTWKLIAIQNEGGPNKEIIRPYKIQRSSYHLRKELLKQTPNENIVEITNHPLLDLLVFGNESFMGMILFQLTQQHLDLVGEAFWLMEKNRIGQPVSLWALPPDWVRALPSTKDPFYRICIGPNEVKIPVTEIIQFIDPDPANPYGRGSGIAKSLGDELETDEYASKHLKGFFYNRARPDLIISADGLAPEETTRLEEKWLTKHQGFWNVFKPSFISRKVDIKELGQTFEHMQMVEIRKHERDTIIQVYGLPPEKFGIVNESKRCHDSSTECLTKRGWLSYNKIKDNDLIATWNSNTEKLEYQKPNAIFIYDHDGDLHFWKGKRIDIAVTPNHEMWYSANSSYGWQKLTSDEILRKSYKRNFYFRGTGGNYEGKVGKVLLKHLPTISGPGSICPDGSVAVACNYDGPEYWEIDPILFARFLGWYISEGCPYHKGDQANKYPDWKGEYGLRVCQQQGVLSRRIKKNLEDLNMGRVWTNVDDRPDKTIPVEQHSIRSKTLWHYIKDNVGFGAENKRIPRECFDWPKEAQFELLNCLIDGDGHWSGIRGVYNNVWFSSTSKKLADDIQQLCIQLGLRCRVNAHHDNRTDHVRKPQYFARISSKKNYSILHEHCEVKNYKGKVWCVSVPNGLVFTRRNGIVTLSSNSTIAAADLFWTKDILLPRLDTLRAVMQERLVPLFDERLILDYESPVVQDDEHQLNIMKAAPWAYTRNEWRKVGQHQPVDEMVGDVFMQPLNEYERPLEGEFELPQGPSAPELPEGEIEESGGELIAKELIKTPEMRCKIRNMVQKQLNTKLGNCT